MDKFIGKKQLADQMGISLDTLRRKAKERGIFLGNKKLLSPAEANDIKQRLLYSKTTA